MVSLAMLRIYAAFGARATLRAAPPAILSESFTVLPKRSERSRAGPATITFATVRYAPTGFRFRRGNPWGFKSLLEH